MASGGVPHSGAKVSSPNSFGLMFTRIVASIKSAFTTSAVQSSGRRNVDPKEASKNNRKTYNEWQKKWNENAKVAVKREEDLRENLRQTDKDFGRKFQDYNATGGDHNELGVEYKEAATNRQQAETVQSTFDEILRWSEDEAVRGNEVTIADLNNKVEEAARGRENFILISGAAIGLAYSGASINRKSPGKPSSNKQAAGKLSEEEKQALQKKAQEQAKRETPADGRCLGGDPIDLVTGEVIMQLTDFTLPGVLPVQLARTHVSGYASGTLFGPNWASIWGQWLEIDDEDLIYHSDDGASFRFPVPLAGQTLSHHTQQSLSVRREEHVYIVQWRNGPAHLFEPVVPELARLATIVDRNRNRLDFLYDEAGRLTEVRQSGGAQLKVDSVQGRITQISLVHRNGEMTPVARYNYHANGTLAQHINSSGRPFKFDYDAAKRLSRWEDRNGKWYAYHYDDQGRAVLTEGSESSLVVTLKYDSASRTTHLTNSLGHQEQYTHNEALKLVRKVDAAGGITTYEYNQYDQKTRETSPTGAITEWGYDEQGNLVTLTDALGQTTGVMYNTQGLPITIIEPSGTAWMREYDELGNLTGAGNAFGWWRYERDTAGNIVRVLNPAGADTNFAYDGRGLVVAAGAVQSGQVTYFERDDFGFIRTRIDPLGQRSHYDYTVEGHLTDLRLPDGSTRQAHYDVEGCLIRQLDPLGQATRYEYGPFDKLTAIIEPNGATTRYAYDTELHLIQVTNPLGQTWHYDYDAAGRCVAETDFSGRSLRYAHDANGAVILQTNAQGEVTELRRDLLGRLIERISPEGSTRFEYDQSGRLLRATGPDATVALRYDPFGRVISETQNGREIRSSYDPLGRRIQRATASGHESLWQFDANGLPTALELPDAQAFAFLHDALGRETGRQLPGGARTEQAFDPVGRLTNQRTQLNERSGRLLQERRIQYRADGLPAQIDDSRRGALSFHFSPTGQVLHAQGRDAQGQQRHEQYAYDLAGNLLEAINYNARGEPEASTLGARSYQGSRLTLAGKVRYLYDAEGRIVKRIEGKRWGGTNQREWLYEWTSDSRLKRLTTPEGQVWRYGYDAFGRRLSKREEKPEGQAWIEIQYLWDGNVLAEEVRLRHTPKPDGTRQTETLKSITWDYEPGTWRPLSQTETLHHANGETQRNTYAILSDHLGTPKELLDQQGEIAWAADSDLWGDTTVLAEAKTNCPLRFQGQYFDEESRLAYNCQRYYDPATGRYLSNDPLGLVGGPSPHAYVPNPLTWVDPLGLCCKENKPDFYVGPSGPDSTLPSTGYRYMGYENADGSVNQYAQTAIDTHEARLSYFGFEKFSTGDQVTEAFQIRAPKHVTAIDPDPAWSDGRMRLEFDTLQLYENGKPNVAVPYSHGGTGTELEPFTTAYPQYGTGNTRQLVPSKTTSIKADKVDVLPQE